MRQLRYEGARLDDVLARIRADHGDDASIVSAEVVRSGGVAGFFTKELYRVLVNPDAPRPETGPGAPSDPVGAETSAASDGSGHHEPDPDRRFAELLAELIDQPDPDQADSLELSDAARVRAALGAPRSTGLLPPVHPAADRRLATPPAAVRAASRSDGTTGGSEEIIDLIDGHARPGGPADPVDITTLMAAVRRHMKPPPPVIRSGILAVIGARGDAIRAAVALSESLGATATDVVIAAPSAAQAVEASAIETTARDMADFVREHALQRATRGSSGPTIVAVIVTPGMGGHRWATDLISELSPLQTRLAVAGWRPIERLEQTIYGLGGVDVVDLVDSGRAPEPERFLDLPVPVGMIDGRPATPTIWAATLASRGRAAAITEMPSTNRVTGTASAHP